MPKPTRAILGMVGGKARQGPWIIDHLPRYIESYVEPYCGAATVLLNREATGVETMNDIDHGITTLFRILRDCDTEKLVRMLQLTPYSREEFVLAKQPIDPTLPDEETGRRLFVRFSQAFGGLGQTAAHNTAHTDGGWALAKASKSHRMGISVGVWLRRIDRLYQVAERLRQVQIECRPALQVLKAYDRTHTVFFVDPPYLPDAVRNRKASKRAYAHSMTVEDHEELLEVLVGLKGMVLISGYYGELYQQTLEVEHGWVADKRSYNANVSAKKKANSPRVEALWSNPALVAAAGQ